MSDNRTITLPQGELAAYQRAIESAKDRIALLARERDEARERERIISKTYDGQQQSYRELEALYQAAQERALQAEADAQGLRTTALAYVTSATYDDRARLRAELHVLATVEHPGVLLLAELEAARTVIAAARQSYEVLEWPRDARSDLVRALAAYDAAVKGGSE